MKLAFSGESRYTDFSGGYDLYVKRSKSGECIDEKMYRKVIRMYCQRLADHLLALGMVDLPCGLGSVSAAVLTRKPQYRGKRFIGYGKKDWTDGGRYDGTLKTFGMVFLPSRNRTENIRSFGFVANRSLFKKMKALSLGEDCNWIPLEYNDEMI